MDRKLADLSLEKVDTFREGNEEYSNLDGYMELGPDATLASAGGNWAEKGLDVGEVCAVCLNTIQLQDLAIIKGCEHEYCVNCILQWALCKETPWCPQCKKPFNYLYCHRLLDGTLSDVPVEESVCLLKRATWFLEHVKTLEKGKAISASMAADEIPADWTDPYQFYDEEDDDYDEDEQIEKYYFSSAAGRARVVLGNRRLGENGYMRAGRMYARPANNDYTSQAGGSGSGSIGKAGKGRMAGSKAVPPTNNPEAVGASASSRSPGGTGASGAGPSTVAAAALAQGAKGQGRRAKRNARRAAADFEQL